MDKVNVYINEEATVFTIEALLKTYFKLTTENLISILKMHTWTEFLKAGNLEISSTGTSYGKRCEFTFDQFKLRLFKLISTEVPDTELLWHLESFDNGSYLTLTLTNEGEIISMGEGEDVTVPLYPNVESPYRTYSITDLSIHVDGITRTKRHYLLHLDKSVLKSEELRNALLYNYYTGATEVQVSVKGCPDALYTTSSSPTNKPFLGNPNQFGDFVMGRDCPGSRLDRGIRITPNEAVLTYNQECKKVNDLESPTQRTLSKINSLMTILDTLNIPYQKQTPTVTDEAYLTYLKISLALIK